MFKGDEYQNELKGKNLDGVLEILSTLEKDDKIANLREDYNATLFSTYGTSGVGLIEDLTAKLAIEEYDLIWECEALHQRGRIHHDYLGHYTATYAWNEEQDTIRRFYERNAAEYDMPDIDGADDETVGEFFADHIAEFPYGTLSETR